LTLLWTALGVCLLGVWVGLIVWLMLGIVREEEL